MRYLIKVFAVFFLLQILSTRSIAQTVEDEEEQLYTLVNSLRTDPRAFLRSVVRPYLLKKGMDSRENKYVASLISDLKKQKKLLPLTRDPFLGRKARAFALDMGQSGSYGHFSKKLGGLSQRLKRDKSKYLGENCSYGHAYAIDILMQLLIDDGVPSLGHRKNLLNHNYTRIGLAIEGHKKYNWNCVMDFAASR